MLDLRRVGLFLRDDEQDYPTVGLEKVLGRANIHLVVDAASQPAHDLDLLIALGGDGTVLRALTAYPDVPVLAVNFGNVGFLTQSDREEFDRVIMRLLSDDYFIEERLTMEICHRGQTYRSINEMVLKGVTHMVEVDIYINDRLVHTPRGDGVIIGTPTGSTAYLLSTGAPLVVPDVDCLIVKPLNEYSFSSRTIILPGNANIRLKLDSNRETDVRLTVDGLSPVRLDDGDELTITRSHQPARLVCFESDYFFRNLRERLRW